MAISQGDKLPDAVLRRMGDNGPEEITIDALTAGRKIVLFGLPGAFTPKCSSAHVPSFMRTKDAFLEKGIEEIICVSVNDVHIMRQWGEATGATAAGLSM
ncbi:MAG: redoxin family protein, partial [Planktomarina temperata]|nr:redoxin family protein [Planktomarina temperata]